MHVRAALFLQTGEGIAECELMEWTCKVRFHFLSISPDAARLDV
jgi:hypothetical protein